MSVKFFSAGYLAPTHDPFRLKKIVDEAAEIIEKKFKKADAIAFTGVSGASIGYPLSYKLGLPVLNVRKKGSETHSCSTVEGGGGKLSRYIIVDDLIDTGTTMHNIMERLEELKCVGIVLYADNCGRASWNKIPISNVLGLAKK